MAYTKHLQHQLTYIVVVITQQWNTNDKVLYEVLPKLWRKALSAII